MAFFVGGALGVIYANAQHHENRLVFPAKQRLDLTVNASSSVYVVSEDKNNKL